MPRCNRALYGPTNFLARRYLVPREDVGFEDGNVAGGPDGGSVSGIDCEAPGLSEQDGREVGDLDQSVQRDSGHGCEKSKSELSKGYGSVLALQLAAGLCQAGGELCKRVRAKTLFFANGCKEE